jgi:hypothetical protein
MARTYQGDWRKAIPAANTNDADTSFTTIVPTSTKPANDGVVDLLDTDLGESSGTFVPSLMQVIPIAENTADDTFHMRVWGWSKYGYSGTAWWIPIMIAEFTVTTGTQAAGFEASTFMPDTIVLADGDADTLVVSTANNVTAYAVIDLMGSELIEFDFDAALAAEMNCLYKFVN